MKIDVTIATKNNQDTIEKVIRAIQCHIPYNRIILVDDSTDNTPELAADLGAEIYHCAARLGEKRIVQAKLAETEWMACIDSDVFVYPNWWEMMSPGISEARTGIINGYLDSDFIYIFPVYENYTKYCARLRSRLTRRIGCMSSVLVKRELLLRCAGHLQGVHAGEDTIIGRAIKDMGFSYIPVRTPIGFHWHKDPIAHHMMAYYRAGASARGRCGMMRGSFLAFKAAALHVLQLFGFFLNTRKIDVKLTKFIFNLYLLYCSGIAHSECSRIRIRKKISQLFDYHES
ncbi:glycosyltransferase family 2 protein [bacterium]|nr:glycosyltransferase family 2 protein [bacterium]